MEETILHRLKAEMEKLTPSQQKVASYILKNSMEVPFMTMEQVAFKVEVSAATIMRLAYHFGYSGYSELQKELQGNIRRQLEPSKQFAEGTRDSAWMDRGLTAGGCEIVEDYYR